MDGAEKKCLMGHYTCEDQGNYGLENASHRHQKHGETRLPIPAYETHAGARQPETPLTGPLADAQKQALLIVPEGLVRKCM